MQIIRTPTRRTVELAHALQAQEARDQRYGEFFALGHVRGRRYREHRIPGGVTTRLWEDGEVERLGFSPTASDRAESDPTLPLAP